LSCGWALGHRGYWGQGLTKVSGNRTLEREINAAGHKRRKPSRPPIGKGEGKDYKATVQPIINQKLEGTAGKEGL